VARIIANEAFAWRGLDLHFGQRAKPVLTLVADPRFPHLYRIRYPNGWESTPANITRAKDAAYGHARYLLTEGTALEAARTAEGDTVEVTLPVTAKEAA
jgi:hypothetical protein